MAVRSKDTLTNPVIRVPMKRLLRCCCGQSLGNEYVSRAVARKTCGMIIVAVINWIMLDNTS